MNKTRKLECDRAAEFRRQDRMQHTYIRELLMRLLAISFLAFSVGSSLLAQSQPDSSQAAAKTAVSEAPVSSSEKIGKNDVVSITVYDAPQLTGNVRVNSDGDIRLPMVRQHIHAEGLTADGLENAVAAALVDEQVMVSPSVFVSILEYHSRSITVFGAVRNPTTIQVSGTVTLLEAIVKAGGLSENAGSVIEISHPHSLSGGGSEALTERIQAHSLMDVSDPASDLTLDGGEYVRVVPAGRIFVVGNVKRAGPVQITDGSESSVLKAVTLSGGLDSFTYHTAYIYRVEASGHKDMIPIQIKKIMTFKSPDVPLYGDDMLYVPSATGQRITAKALELSIGIGFGIVGIVLYLTR
jgi:polysaccharide biosynthesis/export protein